MPFKLLPAGLIATLGAGQAVVLAAMQYSPETITTSTSLTVTLAGCIVWAFRHVLGKTIPDLAANHTAAVERVCETFEQRSKQDREDSRERHRELLEAVREIRACPCQNPQQDNSHA